MTTTHQQGRQLNHQPRGEKKEAKEREFTTCPLLKLAAFQKNFPFSTTFHDGWMDFWEYIESRLADVCVHTGREGSGRAEQY